MLLENATTESARKITLTIIVLVESYLTLKYSNNESDINDKISKNVPLENKK